MIYLYSFVAWVYMYRYILESVRYFLCDLKEHCLLYRRSCAFCLGHPVFACEARARPSFAPISATTLSCRVSHRQSRLFTMEDDSPILVWTRQEEFLVRIASYVQDTKTLSVVSRCSRYCYEMLLPRRCKKIDAFIVDMPSLLLFVERHVSATYKCRTLEVRHPQLSDVAFLIVPV